VEGQGEGVALIAGHALEGGLLIHSLSVYRVFSNFAKNLQNVRKDSLIIAALLHDLCKVNFYTKEIRNRKIPGSDGVADNYELGFRGLKEIGYNGAVSLEAGWVPKGTDAKGKAILPDMAERHVILTKMCELLRRQWEEA
jgi:sugar phosphate isomerase/epimerase